MKEELEALQKKALVVKFVCNDNERPYVVKGKIDSVGVDCVVVKTFNNLHIIPFSQILKVKATLNSGGRYQ